MNVIRTLLKTTTILIVVFSFIGCENDFDTLGTDIIGEPGFNASLYDEAEISVTNVDLQAVQTNNLQFSRGNNVTSLNLLGFYNDPIYGSQLANVLSQLSLSATNPDFGNEPVMDSVVLDLPYFSTQGEPDESGVSQYRLDSVYGNSAIKLSIVESNLFLNNYDPESNFQTGQRYYSDMHPQIERQLTGRTLFETESFVPSSEEIVLYQENAEGEQDTIGLSPRMRLKLSNEFFQEKVLNQAGSVQLSSNNSFQNYLRGLYFRVESVGTEGSMMLLNFRGNEAGITLYYTSMEADLQDEDEDEDTEELVPVQNSYRLFFGPGLVNTFEQDSPSFSDENLYIKGGEGSMAVIELFSDGNTDDGEVSEELEYLRDNNWLVNEANLFFFVDQSKMAGVREPQRLYLYDLENNVRLADYVLENPTASPVNPLSSTSNQSHLGVLQRDEQGNGVSYKIRITEHIRRVLSGESENVKLGLVVTQNVNILETSAVREASNEEIERIPAGSVISPLGTVLHGPNADEEEKRLKLRIYYTEPKN